jgi:hypothetical protein
MTASEFVASLDIRSDDSPPHWADARVYLEEVVRGVLDTIGLFHGCAVDCEVVQLETPDGEVFVLDSAFGGLNHDHTVQDFRAMSLASQFVRGLRLGLADFRVAIRVPQDTAFLAYRALDGIRADVAEREGIMSDAVSWDRMRAITGLSRPAIDAIKTIADARRHGVVVSVTNEQRAESLRLLQSALIAYCDWCVANLDALARVLDDGSAQPSDLG